MAIIAQESVGDITYYQVDDVPSHSAVTGSVAIMTSGSSYVNGFTYVNNGGTSWLKCISPSYGSMYLDGATNVVDFDAQTIGSWYAFNGTPTGAAWTLNTGSTSEWFVATENSTTDDLEYSGNSTIRAILWQDLTFGGGSGKWLTWENTIAVNFSVITTLTNQDYCLAGGSMTQGNIGIRELTTNDYVLPAVSPLTREAGGPGSQREWTPRYCQMSALKIDEPLISAGATILVDEDWESNSFTANSWTVVNDTTNQWVTGTAQVSGGTYGVYGSNDGGTTANYSNAGDVSHFYKDFTFPAGEIITLTFTWRSWMENAGGATQYDYGTVNIIDTTTTPVAGTEVATALATAGGNGRLNETGANTGKFNEGYKYSGGYDGTWFTETIDLSDYAGSTKRLVFSLKDDGAAPADAPAMSIDNILLTYGGGNVY